MMRILIRSLKTNNGKLTRSITIKVAFLLLLFIVVVFVVSAITTVAVAGSWLKVLMLGGHTEYNHNYLQ